MTTTAKLQVLLAHFYPGQLALTPSIFQWVDVQSFEDAAKKIAAYQEENFCYGNDWFGGIVRDDKKTPVAVISPNGTVGTVEENKVFLGHAKRFLKKP